MQRKIHIKWVRSAIAFSYRQKDMVRSLGLRRLNQVVERPDTPQIRGLVARIPHLVEVVEPVADPFRFSIPEFTLLPPEAEPAKGDRRPAEQEAEPVAGEALEGASVARDSSEASAKAAKEKKKEKAAAPARADKAKKAAKPAAGEKKKVGKAEEKKKPKTAAKSGKSTKSGKK
ncbi:MAG: 50S ribosomal protein L30 [Acidobacteria bacterium]|nr:50S ribosomal protein L30 [Acidobacteriota bacterium]